jgi:Tfp pilus assembly protein PilO
MITRLIPIAALVLAAGLAFGYIMSTYKGPITDSMKKITSYQGAIDAANTFSKKENVLSKQRAGISQNDLDRLNAYLPDGVNNVQLILDLDGLAARSGMTLSSFDVKAGDSSSADASALQSANPVDSLMLSVTATGSYTQFRTFLAGIEQSLRPMDITAVSIASDGTGGHKYTLSIRIYWLH